jgi:fucose permease
VRWIVGTLLLLFFLYAAVEVTTGQWAFTLLTETRGLPAVLSGIGVALFWGSFTLGRPATGALGHRLSARALLVLSDGGSLVGVSAVAWSPTAPLGFAGLPVAGFFLGPFFPGPVSAVPLRVGADRSISGVGGRLASANLGVLAGSAVPGAVAARGSLALVGPWLFALAVLLVLVVVDQPSRIGPTESPPAAGAVGKARSR